MLCKYYAINCARCILFRPAQRYKIRLYWRLHVPVCHNADKFIPSIPRSELLHLSQWLAQKSSALPQWDLNSIPEISGYAIICITVSVFSGKLCEVHRKVNDTSLTPNRGPNPGPPEHGAGIL